jgi:flavin-dependent dehydrogenase
MTLAPAFDLLIIGGGPAGTAAAITAARAGARVLLLERGRYPRHKVCGEFISAEGVSLLQSLGLDDLLARVPRINRARIFAAKTVAEALISPAAAAISRHKLDDSLWQLAASSGTDCRLQTEAHGIHGAGPFTVATSAGSFITHSVINASGRWSNLRRTNLLAPPARKWVGWKAHFREADAPLSVDLYFFPEGYCGVQPIGAGRINACAMVRASAADSISEVLQLHPALAARSRAWQPAFDPIATAPLVFGAPQPEEGGVLFAGDAAGFIDPFIGDGISLALRSGAMAATALRGFWKGKCSLAEAAACYRRTYDRELRPLFRNAGWLRRLTSMPRVLHRPVMAALRSPHVAQFLIRKTRARFG